MTDLNPRKPTTAITLTRVAKIRQAVLVENDTNAQQLPELSEQDQHIRESYGEHKRTSKSREKSSSRQTAPNKYKRPKDDSQFSQKYKQLEENFKKFQTFVKEKRELPVLQDLPLPQPVQLVNLSQPPQSHSGPNEDYRLQAKQALHLLSQITSKIQTLTVCSEQELNLSKLQNKYTAALSSAHPETEQILQSSLLELKSIFNQVMQRVMQIESVTFQNYKLKDVNRLLETMLRESHRLVVNSTMPQFLSEYNRYSYQAGLTKWIQHYRSKQMFTVRSLFNRWRGKPGKQLSLQRLIARLDRSKQKQIKAFYLMKQMVYHQPLCYYLLSDYDQCIESDTFLVNHVQQVLLRQCQMQCDLVLVQGDTVTTWDQTYHLRLVSNSVTLSKTGMVDVGYKHLIDKPRVKAKTIWVEQLYYDGVLLGVLKVYNSIKATEVKQQLQLYIGFIVQKKSQVKQMQLQEEQYQQQQQQIEQCNYVQSQLLWVLSGSDLKTTVDGILLSLYKRPVQLRQVFLKEHCKNAAFKRVIETPVLKDEGCLVRRTDGVDFIDFKKNVVQQITLESETIVIVLHYQQLNKKDVVVLRKEVGRQLTDDIYNLILKLKEQDLNFQANLAAQQQLVGVEQCRKVRAILRSVQEASEIQTKLQEVFLNVAVMVWETVYTGEDSDLLVGRLTQQQAALFKIPLKLEDGVQTYTHDLGLQGAITVGNLAVIQTQDPCPESLQLCIKQELSHILGAQLTQSQQLCQFNHQSNALSLQLQASIIDADFMQAVQECLVVPFTHNPSIKQLATCLHALSDKALPLVALQSVSYRDTHVMITDCATMTSSSAPQESAISVAFSHDDRRLVLHFVSDDISDELLAHVSKFHHMLSPFITTALQSINGILSPKQNTLIRVLSKILNQRKLLYTYQLITSLNYNRVPIFTRLKSYKNVLRSFQHDGYLEHCKQQWLERQHVFQVYASSFQTLNIIATKTKQRSFDRFKYKVLECMQFENEQLYSLSKYQPTKKQLQAFGIVHAVTIRMVQRAHFSKLAVKSRLFRKLTNPHNRAMAVALSLALNYQRLRLRVGFLRMKGNAVGGQYRDFTGIATSDRILMQDLQREFLKSLPAQDDLESQLAFVLERAILYLQQSLLPESLDAIVCSLQLAGNSSTARAFVFNRNGKSEMEVNRIERHQVIDRVMAEHMDLYSQNKNFSDFNLDMHSDIILQMLLKSQQVFNFSNISNSLYELYASQFGLSPNPDTASRMMLLKKSKAALICPLTHDEGLIGSLELYKQNSEIFKPEMESRLQVFCTHLASLCRLLTSISFAHYQALSLKQDIAYSAQPPYSLTQLLKSLQSRAGTLKASHFQCLLLNKNGLAYFYQFRDNLIYSFGFEGTLIQEVQLLNCVVELANPNAHSVQTATQRNVAGPLKSITGVDGLARILYYPVGQTAVFEIGFTEYQDTDPVQIQQLISQFNAHLKQLTHRIQSFALIAESLLTRKMKQQSMNVILRIKATATQNKIMAEYNQIKTLTDKQSKLCESEYQHNIASYDRELKRQSELREALTQEVNALRLDRQTKFKLLGTCLAAIHKCNRYRLNVAKQAAFLAWKAKVTVSKVVDTGYHKLQELNTRHLKASINAASFLLKKSCFVAAKRSAFQVILIHTQMEQKHPILDSVLSVSSKAPCLSSKYGSIKMNNLSEYATQQRKSNAAPWSKHLLSSGPVTPLYTSVQEQTSHLNHLQRQLGFGAVPVTKCEKKKAKKGRRKSAPQVTRKVIH